jgi:hypothetical protein
VLFSEPQGAAQDANVFVLLQARQQARGASGTGGQRSARHHRYECSRQLPRPALFVWEGLDLLPYAIAVHYKSDHPESSSTDREIEFYQTNGIPYRALRDGQALVVNGATTKIVE